MTRSAAAVSSMIALPIHRVTVHPDGAMVHRAGAAPVTDGQVRVGGLPLLLDPSSLRAEVVGARLREVRVHLDLLGEDRGDEPEPLTNLRGAQDELRLLEATLDGLLKQREVATLLAPTFDEEADPPTADRVANWIALEGAVAPWIAEIDTAIRKARKEREALVERIAILTQHLADQSDEGLWRRWAPTRRAELRIDGDGPVEIAMSYRVRGATWSPAYVLDADRELQTGRFAMRALVSQATGEDWMGVAVRLTTAPGRRRIDLPELPSLRLGTRQAPPRPAWRALPIGFDALFPEDLSAEAGDPAPTTGGREPGWNDDVDLYADAEDDIEILTEVEAWEEDKSEIADEGAYAAQFDRTALLDLASESSPRSKSAGPGAALAGLGMVIEAAAEVAMDAATAVLPASAPTGGLYRGDAAPPGAPAAPPPPPQQALTKQVSRRMRVSRVQTPLKGQRSRVIEVGHDHLDYGRLRLEGYDGDIGVRGRLQPSDDLTLLTEAGLPPAALERFGVCVQQATARVNGLQDRPLPPHHVLPVAVGDSDQVFDVEGTIDLPSDGRAHSIAVFAEPAKLEVRYRAVARHDPRAFRRVRASLDRTEPLLPGPVDIYVGGALELTAPWTGSSGRGGLEVGLGAEDRLKLVRNVRYREERAGLLGGSRKMHTTIEVKVASSLDRPVQIQVMERVPVPADPNQGPEIEITTSTPIVRSFNGDRDGPILKGAKVQTLEVPPRGEARAVLGYAVTLGAKEELVGGDRRG